MAEMMITMNVPVCVYQEADVYVAHCPLLDVASQGCSREEARSNLAEALELFIETCIEMGTLDAVLKQCGFKQIPKPADAVNSGDQIEVSLPYYANSSISECRA